MGIQVLLLCIIGDHRILYIFIYIILLYVFIHSVVLSWVLACSPDSQNSSNTKTGHGRAKEIPPSRLERVQLGRVWKITHQSSGTGNWAGWGKERWIFPLLKGELNSWTNWMCFPVFCQLAKSGGRMDVSAYFLRTVFTDLHFERANCWVLIFLPHKKRALFSD